MAGNLALPGKLDSSNASLRSTVKRVKANLWKRDLFTPSNVLEVARDRAERRSTGRNARSKAADAAKATAIAAAPPLPAFAADLNTFLSVKTEPFWEKPETE